MKRVIAVLACVLVVGCQRDVAPVASAATEQRFEKHMKLAGEFCGLPDWRQIFLAKVAHDRVVLLWREKPAGGQLHPRAAEARCLLGTFDGGITVTDAAFEIPATALRSDIRPRRID